MFVYILCPLSVQDELCFIGNTHNMILHGVAQKSGEGLKRATNITGNRETSIYKTINRGFHLLLEAY